MNIDIETLNRSYNALGDEKSRKIYENRVMYSISGGGIGYIRNIILQNDKIEKFIANLEKCSKMNEIVIFGAGKHGKLICDMLNYIPWKCFVDNNPKEEKYKEIPVISYKSFVENYHGEYIVISSMIYQKEMVEQLNKDGFKKIINFGKIAESLMDNQYFDLEYLESTAEKEIFLDLGCYDARSSINFKKWCKGAAFVYAFEPNQRKIEECKYNLEKNKIDYRLISKGVWKEEATLHFTPKDNMSSYISESGEEVIEVTSLDKVLGDEKVTFIKMDIEGSELSALIGAENIIKMNKPKLAISIYHKMEDIFEIPEIILRYYSNYKLYLRHYFISDSETVLYALPE